MAIVKMKRLELIGLNTERKRLIEYIQSLGVLDISDSTEDLAARETAAAISQIESDMAETLSALEILSPFLKKKGGLFYKRPEIEKLPLTSDEVLKNKTVTSEILRIKKTVSQNREVLSELNAEKKSLEAYINLDLPLGFKKTANTIVRVGMLEGEYSEEKLWQEFSRDELDSVYFQILSADKLHTAVWLVCHKGIEKQLDEALTRLNFVAVSSRMTEKIPSEHQRDIEGKIAQTDKENTELESRLIALSGKSEELELFYDKLASRRDKYNVLSRVGITENTFFVTGYLPAEAAEMVKAEFEGKFTVSAELFEPTKEEDVPKSFKNNAFTEPVEGITYDYSMPASHDVDPNPVMAFFYYLFFGMMFSDAGYGLLMMIACGLLGYGNFIEKEKRQAYKMFFICGISTTFWGIMYGSFFGDMLATVSKTFGSGQLALTPILFDPVKKPLELLIISVALGLVHIITALCVKFYVTWRAGDKMAAIFDTGFWITLLLGIAVFAAGFGVGIETIKTVGLVMLIASAAGLILTQGRSNKNPVMKLFGGILSLYDITSYVGDVLSYSRLMALGLATGVIASVVNVLGSLGGRSAVGLISFILISIFGHTLNFAINMLGAYVHTNRLQYVEFYQKFYEGGGRRYKPFCFNTKYYRFK